ncbi:uncharacterized protein LOC8272249 isoform X1 [Ricinus communis]|uniref:uncharacterized protein LOC8272249 isoform X1 n=1 Tax=Ricinus communis TaxID=3988 RepID=UPI00201A8E6B|nr:uncharacterized protein LOC8272249 isoform X1 [Ricinus communis]
MGGGNGQKAKMAREKNLEKQRAAAAKGSQLESNKKAMSIQLVICFPHTMLKLELSFAIALSLLDFIVLEVFLVCALETFISHFTKVVIWSVVDAVSIVGSPAPLLIGTDG